VSHTVRLPLDVYGPDQTSLLLFELRSYTNAVHQASIKARVAGQQSTPLPAPSALLTSLLNVCEIDPTDLAALDTLYKQLETELKKAPVMHVTLTAIPGRTLKRQLTVWFRTQIHPLSLLTFTARRDIGGGIILQAGSHLYDHSFRKHILANPKRIGELAGV
jgi:hypothetical protein